MNSMAFKDSFLLPRFGFSIPSRARSKKGARDLLVRATAVGGYRRRRPQNVEGEFFVDQRCIDCDTCRWMAPKTFRRVDEMSAVIKQPSLEEDRRSALQALLSCPTNSIHTEKPTKEIVDVQKSFPLAVDESRLPVLVRNIDILGGAKFMFLTHMDDVADHDKWSKRFGCKRILHSGDVEESTIDVEMKLCGDGPWSIGTEFELIHTPGHTEGSVCLYYKSLKVLFTGDHFARSGDSDFSMFEQYNRVSVNMQLDSLRKLVDLDFKWILPGHGRSIQFRDNQEKNSALEAFLDKKKNKPMLMYRQ